MTATHAHHRTSERRPALMRIDARLRTLVPTALLVVWITAVPAHTWWARALVAAAAAAVAMLGTVSLAGFTVPQWITRRAAVAHRGRHPVTEEIASDNAPPPAAAEVSAPSSPPDEDTAPPAARKLSAPITAVSSGDEVGVDWCGGQLIAALDLHGHPHVPHHLYQRQVTTRAVLPLAELETRLDSLTGGQAPHTVDLVFETRRLAHTRYSPTYDTHLSGQPAAGYRRTLLIARFDPAASPAYYAARESLPDAAAATIARIRRTVAAADCPATALTGPQLQALRHSTAAAAFNGDSAAAVERWTHIAPAASRGVFETVYAIDPVALTDTRITDLWSIRADALIVTLRRTGRGWLGFVRVRDASSAVAPPLPFLRALPGQQAAALAIGRPVAARDVVRTVFEPIPSLAGLTLPTGSDGQVLGADSVGRQLLVPLVPGTDRIIAARVDLAYAQQLILRAEATGANVTIITNAPRRWSPLASPRIAVVPDDAELAIGPDELHVYDDGLAPAPNAAAATLSLTAPSGPKPHGDVVLDQEGDQITVTAGGDTYQIRRRIDPAEIAYLPAAQMVPRGQR